MKYEQKVFKALSDETRYKIIDSLLDGEKCVCDIIPITGKKQSNVSIQLKRLENDGILKSRKEGKKTYYMIKDVKVCKMLRVFGNKKAKSKNCCKRCEE